MNGKPRGSHAVYIDARSHYDPKPIVPSKEPRVAKNAFYKPPEPEPGEITSVSVETHTKLVTVGGVTKKVESKNVTTGRKKINKI
jgi:hypothetical protein